MTKACGLESLPIELVLAVLENLNDVKDLKALVRSSPVCHKCYATHRNAIFTKVTLRTISVRLHACGERRFSTDQLPTIWLQFKNTYRERCPGLDPAIQSCYIQMSTGITEEITFTVPECMELLSIVDGLMWLMENGVIKVSDKPWFSDNELDSCYDFGALEDSDMPWLSELEGWHAFGTSEEI